MHITEGVWGVGVIPGTISQDTDRISWGQNKSEASESGEVRRGNEPAPSLYLSPPGSFP